MLIKVNGENLQTLPGQSIQNFIIDEKKLKPDHVVVEYNGTILKRDIWNKTLLKENDILEIVSFVGGG